MTTIKDFGDQWVWHKSARSTDNGGACVYIARDGDQIGVRDSKEGPGGSVLWFDSNDFEALRKSITAPE